MDKIDIKPKRKNIPKSVRFEVFKRDSFKCQYCGNSAPEVVLHVDHIKAVSKGGQNDIFNLITACQPCNAGKSDNALDENTALKKEKRQLDDLQERRDQIEMMMHWREGLRDIKEEVAQRLEDYWNEMTPGFSITDTGKVSIKKLSLKYSIDQITSAMDTAFEQYFKIGDDGKFTAESVAAGFAKLGGIIRNKTEFENDPELKELHYIKGIMRNRYYLDSVNQHGMRLLQEGRKSGIPVSEMRNYSKSLNSWTDFRKKMEDEISTRTNTNFSLF